MFDRSDSDSDNESGDPEKKKLQDKLSGIILASKEFCKNFIQYIQEGLAVASIMRDDPSTLPGDDPFPCARMHRDRNAR